MTKVIKVYTIEDSFIRETIVKATLKELLEYYEINKLRYLQIYSNDAVADNFKIVIKEITN